MRALFLVAALAFPGAATAAALPPPPLSLSGAVQILPANGVLPTNVIQTCGPVLLAPAWLMNLPPATSVMLLPLPVVASALPITGAELARWVMGDTSVRVRFPAV